MINLSYSAAQKYLSSPFAYFAHYFLRLRTIGTGSALVFGGALDEGFNSLLEDKRDGKEPNLEKAKAAFCNSFLKKGDQFLYEDGVVKFSKADLDESILTPDDLSSGLNKSWLSLNRKGQILIEEYYKQVLPKLEKVLLVQHTIAVTNSNGDKFTGVIDLVAQIDGKTYVIDNKSTTKAYTANSANESPQLATYFEAIRDEYKLDGVAYITVPKTLRKKKKPVVDISVIYGTADEMLIEKTFNEYDDVLTGIRLGQFPCTPEKCCSMPWPCDYARYCNSDGKDTTGLTFSEKK